jgi:ribosome biogenesis GTPase A
LLAKKGHQAPQAVESYQSGIQWYPGHIAKWEKQLDTYLKQVDVVVEVLDARLPVSSRHLALREKIDRKPVVVVLNKDGLADPLASKRWVTWFKQQGNNSDALLFDALQGSKYRSQLIKAMVKVAQPAVQKWVSKGLKARPARVMIVGMPNVGKSSIINCLINQKKVQTGHKAGVTRQPQWIRIHPQVELLDSPGIIPPRLTSAEQGHWLSLVSSVGEAAYDEETVATFALTYLCQHYPTEVTTYANEALLSATDRLLDTLAEAKNLIKAGAQVDTKRAAQILLRDIRQGRLGRLTFEAPCVESIATDATTNSTKGSNEVTPQPSSNH